MCTLTVLGSGWDGRKLPRNAVEETLFHIKACLDNSVATERSRRVEVSAVTYDRHRETCTADEGTVNVNQVWTDSDMKHLEQEMDFLEFCHANSFKKEKRKKKKQNSEWIT